MDQALKQRLIGAAIIVAVVVLIVPVFLEGPGERDATQDITLPESPDVEREPRLLPLNQSPADEPQPVESQAQPVDESLDSPEQYEPPSQGSMSASTEDTPVTSEPEADGDNATMNEPAAQTQPQAEQAAGVDDTTETAASSEPPPQEPTSQAVDSAPEEEAPVADGSFAVQVGGFSSEENAMGLRDRLRDAGFPTFVELYRGGAQPIYRVRVGPAVDRTAAEGLLQRLQAEVEMDGMVVSHP